MMRAPEEHREKGSPVDGIHLPSHLAYSTNHMWLDRSAEGLCHIGVDAFLTQLFRHVDALNFLPPGSSHLPTVVLTLRGVDLQLVFQLPMNVTRVNSYLRADIQKLVSHPYSSGWLYEGTMKEVGAFDASVSSSSRLMGGETAVRWMKNEVQHLSEFVHNHIIPNQIPGQPVLMDGGAVRSDFADYCTKQELLHLFS